MGWHGEADTGFLGLGSDPFKSRPTADRLGSSLLLDLLGSQLHHCLDSWNDYAIYLVVVNFATILQVGGSAKRLAWRRHSGDVPDFTLVAFAGSCGLR